MDGSEIELIASDFNILHTCLIENRDIQQILGKLPWSWPSSQVSRQSARGNTIDSALGSLMISCIVFLLQLQIYLTFSGNFLAWSGIFAPETAGIVKIPLHALLLLPEIPPSSLTLLAAFLFPPFIHSPFLSPSSII